MKQDQQNNAPVAEAPSGNILTIVIPALNEEEAIGGTVSRCLQARTRIQEAADLLDVEVIVVNDGSTDRTSEIARSFDEVHVIDFAKNRGYGAAIKEGWQQGRGTLLGFVDADGTCDPEYFAQMCHAAIEENADVVLGSRLGPNSKMPTIRRIGNRIYAVLLGLLCGHAVTDTASGMRVVRRESLKYLCPLPDGLHFTPSMSARALLNDLRVIEIAMPYEERIGQSKLHVLRDGIQFLRTIFGSVLCFRPERPLLFTFVLCVFVMMLLAAHPTEFYLRHAQLEEWMIYRFVMCYLLGSIGLLLLLATALANQMAGLGPRRSAAASFWPSLIAALLRGGGLSLVLVVLLALSVFFLRPGIVEYATTGQVTMHWSRLLAGAFGLFSAAQTAVFALLIKVASMWSAQAVPAESRPASEDSAPGPRST